ncbi:hypothetical protein [Micromonospora sp. NBC_01796]|uniref:hypothetical protein n=1 Tax=Micromonospora sp. NBC_01796 TaxID=2975987 RepID=UPI002DD924C9|nr:hypothetical protein [Micromonospora sp. NBC_01796]WSA85030.1 hypothetical protein OIE47_32500 [Micromonospora sp. NBC_01796]
MGDHWEGWIDDGPDFGAEPGGDPAGATDFAADDGYPIEGLGPADDHTGGGGAGEEDLDGTASDTGPIGYGDEPFTADTDYPAETRFGPADPDTGSGSPDYDTGFGSADPAPDADAGLGPADDADTRAQAPVDDDARVGFGAAGAPVGADPDLDPYGDTDSWPQPVFPEAFDAGAVPEPVDGFPWADPTALGDADTAPDPATAWTGAPEPTELAGYTAEEVAPGEDPWTALAASDDPATSALARFWGTQAG